MNAAQDIKILNMYLQFGEGYIQKIFFEIKNLVKYKYISNLQRNDILQNKTKRQDITLLRIS